MMKGNSDDSPLEGAAGVGLDNGDRFEAAIPTHGFVGADLVEPPAIGAPAPLMVFENGRRVGGVVEVALEIDSNKRQETAGSAVASPKDFIAPTGVLPADPLARIDAGESGDEPRLEVFALAAERLPRLIDLKILKEEAERPAQNAPGREYGKGKDAGPDQPSHCSTPRLGPRTSSPERAL